MEPLKPEVKKAILESNPQAEPGDIEEYEKLLALQFTTDPDVGPSAAPITREGHPGPSAESVIRRSDAIQSRLRELHAKLFPADKRRQ